jgi:arylsulfatase A-like enzyme
MTMDWSATLLDIGGGTPHPDYPLDGVSLREVLSAPNKTFERPLFWRMNHRHQRAMRDGDWKYLKVDENEYLFNLAQDERERANLSAKESARFETMRKRYLEWERTVPSIPEDAVVSLVYSPKDMPQR